VLHVTIKKEHDSPEDPKRVHYRWIDDAVHEEAV
ncbi:uncharacterized protein METZ01_LOCUS367293, partial [marine metagenome]